MAILMWYFYQHCLSSTAALIYLGLKQKAAPYQLQEEDIEGTGHFLSWLDSRLHRRHPKKCLFFSNTGATTNNNMQYSGLTYIFMKLNIPGDNEVTALFSNNASNNETSLV